MLRERLKVMQTTHQVIFDNATRMAELRPESIDLMVTSPPYPMIEMWDSLFSQASRSVSTALDRQDGPDAFEAMHRLLDEVWAAAHRVLKPGGFACINIGDATRTIQDRFGLYPNHARVIKGMLECGFTVLPGIIWRKQTNAPNKFMGSGMLPAGAYVTLEHEHLLVFRKGPKRAFNDPGEKLRRRQSALFWEERNLWYSDVWFDIKGASQELAEKESRNRSAAFPFEVAWRLILMYSVREDLVVDPFLGTGTTSAAAMAAARNSIGYEIDPAFKENINRIPRMITDFSKRLNEQRLARHVSFVAERLQSKGDLKYINKYYRFPVMTKQEQALLLNDVRDVSRIAENTIRVGYLANPQTEFCRNWELERMQNDEDVLRLNGGC